MTEVDLGKTTERGMPMAGGLSDLRLGTIDKRFKCETCSSNMGECPGHFGHLELAKPMFHIGFMKTLLTIMRCVCFNCSKILADEVTLQPSLWRFGLLLASGNHWLFVHVLLISCIL